MAQSVTNLRAMAGNGWHVASDDITTALGHATGAVTPIGAVTPTFIGQEYFDTVAGVFYRAVGVTSADWTVIGDPGLTAAELSVLDGVTPGTAAASKALVLDSGLKLSGVLSMTYGAGTATVAPQTMTAGTSLTTAAAGAREYDGKVFYATAVASSRQVIVTDQFCVLTSNYTAVDQAAAQKIFNSSTNGALTVAASTSYLFECMFTIANTGTTSHTWAFLFGGTATFTGCFYQALVRTGTTSAATLTALSSLEAAVATATVLTAASTSATEFVTVLLKGVIEINAAGTIIPQMQASAQPGASGTPGVTVLAGSYFRCSPLGTSTVAAVGNWS